MKKSIKKGLIKFITLIVIVALPVGLLAGCTTNLDNTENEVLDSLSNAYVSLKINPEVELGVDENGNIDSVYCVNEDAEILLSETNLVGMSYDSAAETFVDLATQAGYIDVEGEDNEVIIGVITEAELTDPIVEEPAVEEPAVEEPAVEEPAVEEPASDEEICDRERMENRLEERINRYFENHGIFGVVTEETLEEYQELATELDVSLGQVKMMMRAIELNPELTLDDVQELRPNVLMALCKDKGKNEFVNSEVREEFKADCEGIREEFENIPVLREEILAIEEQLENFEGTEEERAILETSLEEKNAEFETQKTAMKEGIDAAREEYKAQREEIRQENVQQKQQKMEQNRQKNQEHAQEFESNSEQQVQNVKTWRNGKK